MSSNSIWKKIDEIFPLVADLPEDVQHNRLDELCGTDEDLRREIAALLAVDDKAKKFIESPVILPNSLSLAFDAQKSGDYKTARREGEKIGAYQILKKIGAGGMGEVYLAKRADGEFQKNVAVKLIKNGADTDFNLTRFRRERQILASLEHPNIARLIDGGTTEKGSPYLVMEYVEGSTLFDYFRERGLNLNERLKLFRQVCAAVSYAHSKGLIHRDIKPGNILVTESGAVKLLDFGIAKILETDFIEEPPEQTATFMRQMTPEYASPEQVTGEAVTAASDVYSLGVVLYELVSGERPYKFSSRAAHEIARVICEEKVRPPKSDLQSPVSDDLSFIVLKSLQKKTSERYASVAEFDGDIERFLNGLPVLTENTRLEYFENSVGNSVESSISLAIAPFAVLPSGDKNAENTSDNFLGWGLADALTTKLSGIRQIVVRPTSSVMRLAAESKDALALGTQLNTDYVLEGHILHAGEKFRVNVQLLKIRDDSVLWAEQFDERGEDVFRLQDSISEQVANSLVPRLTTEEQKILRRHGTNSAKAYEAYLRGRVSYHTYTFDGIAASENYFMEAISYDANFALAHSGLADFYNWQSVAGQISSREGFAKAKESAGKAIEIDPNLSEAYASLAFATWAFDWDFAEAERLFQKSIRLNPNNVKAHEWYSYLLSSEARHDEAVEEMRRAERLDPNSAAVAAMFSFCLFNARRYEEAYEKTHQALKIEPDYYLALQGLGWVCPPLGLFDEAIEGCRRAVLVSNKFSFNQLSLGLALIAAGQFEEAREIALEIENETNERHVPAYYPALIYAALGEFDKAFDWLDRAIEERGYWTLWMRVEPRFDRLREDPRFAERLEKIKPSDGAKTTANLVVSATEEILFFHSDRLKSAVAAAFIFICAVAGVSYLAVFEKNDPPNTPASTSENIIPEKSLSNDPVANDLYRAGQKQLETRAADGIKKAIEFFTEAADRDPNFALALASLADSHILLAEHEENSRADNYRKAEEYAVKALALDPDSAEARVSLGMAKYKNTKDFAQAEKHFLRAIELDPSFATAHHWYSVILNDQQKFEEALREAKIAVELKPDSAVIQSNLAELYLRDKFYDKALLHYDKAIEIDNEFAAAYYWKSLIQQFKGDYDGALDTYRKQRIYNGSAGSEPLWLLMKAQAHAAAGRKNESLDALKQFFDGDEYRTTPNKFTIEIALVYRLLGDDKNTFAWLEKVAHPEDFKFLKKDPRFAELHADRRFDSLITRRLEEINANS